MPPTSDNTLIYGKHPVLDAIRAGKTFDKIILQQGIRGDFEKEVRLLCRQYDIPLQNVPKERLYKFTKANHQGIIGFISLIAYQHIEDILPHLYEQSQVPLLLILDGITDVRNFGAIARSAECAGVQAIIIAKKKAALLNADAMKTSAGALAKIPVCRENSLEDVVVFLQNSGVQVLASDLHAPAYLHHLDLKSPTALVLGSEGEGVNPHLLRATDERFRLPQVGTTDSYNVSVAAGMMLYEALRQRLA